LNRVVAYKNLKPKYFGNAAAQRRFLFEGEVTGRLEHPGIVPVYGLGRDQLGEPYYAMRFVSGQSLRDAVKAFHTLPLSAGADRAFMLRRLLSHFVTVCRTIAYAHDRGVIHRDLKPENVMVGLFGETLVVDWGMARQFRPEPLLHNAHVPTAPPTDTGGGTPAYWAPEQESGDLDLHDERTDVYGLGAVLYEILTGKPPQPDGVIPPEPPSPREESPWVDETLDAVTRRALARNQAHRHPSALALADDVERWLADQPIAAQRGAVATLERQSADHPDDQQLIEQLARQRANLGLMFGGMRRDEEALTELHAAAALFRSLAETRAKPRYFAEEANCKLAAARSLEALGRNDAAAAARKEAANLYQRLIATRPDEYRANYASIMLTLCDFPAPPVKPPPPEEGTAVSAPPPADPGITAHPMPTEEVPASTVHPSDAPSGVDQPSTIPPEAASFGDQTLPPPTDLLPAPRPHIDLDEGYAPIRELGRGGLGLVLLVRDKALQRNVAIKLLAEAYLSHPAAQTRFMRELRIAASLEHPNLVRIYTYGVRKNGQPFIVMEYLEGHDLSQLVRERGPGWSGELLDPIAQACDGIHFAHTRGIIHRDPKPTNFMVLKSGRVVVYDWGLAREIAKPVGKEDAAEDSGLAVPIDEGLTHDGVVMGTPAFMSPELARGDASRAGPAGDIYSLGASLFQVITGTTALRADGDIQSRLAAVASGEIPRPRDVRPDVPATVDAICAKAMAFRPEDRYPTAAAFAADIRAFLAGRPISV
jgi:serine/threonine protein kinase